MTLATLENAIESRFLSRITLGGDGGSPTTTQFPNLGIVDGTGATLAEPPTSGLWFETSIRLASSAPLEIGNRAQELTVGLLHVVIRADLGLGQSALRAAYDRIANNFRRINAGGVDWLTPAPSINPHRDGSWWRRSIDCHFWWQVLKAATAS